MLIQLLLGGDSLRRVPMVYSAQRTFATLTLPYRKGMNMGAQLDAIKHEAIESMEHFASMWRVLVGEYSGATIEDRPGLSIRRNATPFPFWHAVFLMEPIARSEQLAVRLHEAATYMRANDPSGLLWISEEYLSTVALRDIPSIAVEEGLELALRATGMAGEIFPLGVTPHPLLRIERITTEQQLLDYAEINCEAYGFQVESGSSLLAKSSLWKDTYFAYMGYEGGRPVSGASAVINDGIVFLALVATRPEAQRKGYAEAVVRHALQAAYEASGLTRSILHASDAGFPVYRRLGYQPTCTILAYKLSQ